jgi:hypothetical protein
MAIIFREFRSGSYREGMDFYNNANAWLQDFVGPVTDTMSSSEARSCGDMMEFSKWAKCLLFNIRLRGERSQLLQDASFCCNAFGSGWKSSYLSAHMEKTAICEVIIEIENEAQAVQFSLTDL